MVKIDSDADNISSVQMDRRRWELTHIEYTAKYDGGHPILACRTDTVALERPDASTIRSTTRKRPGLMTVTSVISEDHNADLDI
jgi:hypothetical protein